MSSVHQKIRGADTPTTPPPREGHDDEESIAQESLPRGIRVNSIAPGAFDPDQHGGMADQGSYDALMRLVPYRRIGEPDDVAARAVCSTSDQADYVVGATLS